jgi:hypothetical protein
LAKFSTGDHHCQALSVGMLPSKPERQTKEADIGKLFDQLVGGGD